MVLERGSVGQQSTPDNWNCNSLGSNTVLFVVVNWDKKADRNVLPCLAPLAVPEFCCHYISLSACIIKFLYAPEIPLWVVV